jgi:ferredoxin
MKNAVVDKKKCIGCGTCFAIARKSFKIGANGKSQVINPPGDDEKTIQTAIDSCPMFAISWKDNESSHSKKEK